MKLLCFVIFILFAVSSCFGGYTTHEYAQLGTAKTIPCGNFHTTERNITWLFDGKPLEPNDYIASPNELQIQNVTTKKLGEYYCYNYVADLSYGDFNRIHLHLAIAPQFNPYHYYAIYGTVNKTVSITCRATAGPPAAFTWYRDGTNVTSLADKYNVTTTHGSSYDESILEFHVTSDQDYGEYVCEASNYLKTIKKSYTVEKLALPQFQFIGHHDGYVQVKLTVENSPPNLSGYQIRFQKWFNKREFVWVDGVVKQKEKLGKDMYAFYGPEPNQQYHIKVGACYGDNRCAFNDTTSIYTSTIDSSSSTMPVYSYAQIFVALTSLFTAYTRYLS